MKPFVYFVLAGLFLTLFIPAAHADTVAVTFTNTTGSLGNDRITMGWEFTVNSAITVTKIGVFDDSLDGFAFSHDVGLWSCGNSPCATSGTLLVSSTVPIGTTAPLTNQFRYAAVTPTNLVPGVYYEVGARYEDFNTDKLIQYIDPVPTFAIASELNFIVDRAGTGFVLTFPNDYSSVQPSYFGPSFQFTSTAVPEPSTSSLLAIALAGLAGLAFVGKRQPKQA